MKLVSDIPVNYVGGNGYIHLASRVSLVATQRYNGWKQIHLPASDLDIGFVNPPGMIGLHKIGAAGLVNFQGITPDLTVEGGVIQRQTPFGHHFFLISVAEGIAQVVTNAKQNDFGIKGPPFEWVFHIIPFHVL